LQKSVYGGLWNLTAEVNTIITGNMGAHSKHGVPQRTWGHIWELVRTITECNPCENCVGHMGILIHFGTIMYPLWGVDPISI